jgi:hypothetical protein
LALPKIAIGAWVDSRLRTEGGAALTLSNFFDHRLFLPKPAAPSSRSAIRIVVLASGSTTDGLVAQALKVLSDRRALGLEFDIVGDWTGGDVALPHRLHGMPAAASRAALFQQATIGIAASFGAPLPFAFELMACAVPLIEVDFGRSDMHERYYGSRVALAAPMPVGIADTLLAIASDLGHWRDLAQVNALELQKLPDEYGVVDQLAQFVRKQAEASVE